MIRWTVLLVMLFAWSGYAQEEALSPEPWQHDVVGALTLSQVAFRDWAQGGEDALAWALSLDGKSAYDVETLNWTTSYKFAFGQAKLGEQGVRKTDDKIDLESLFTYKLGILVNPYAAGTLKTQFARGYQYEETRKIAVSQFLDPVYLTQSAGLGYKPVEQVQTRLGLAVREIVTRDFNSYADDPDTAALEKTRVDGGVESVTEVAWQVVEDVLFTSKLELFTAFKALDEIALRNDNTLAVQVSKYITVKLNVQVLHDKTASEKTQYKETLTLGIGYTLL